MLLADTVGRDITVEAVRAVRLKIPGTPDHFSVLTHDQTKMCPLIVFNRHVLILCRHCFRLFTGK